MFTYLITWGVWLPVTFDETSPFALLLVILGGFGPAAGAALVVTLSGRSARAWFKNTLRWRIHFGWIALAIGLPFVLTLAGVAAGYLLGASITLPQLANGFVGFAVALVPIALLGGGQEEFGWRGFALPRLQRRYSPLTASVIIGVAWALWHVPLALGVDFWETGSSFYLYGLLAVVGSIIFTWIYNLTGGSVFAMMLLHGSFNASNMIGSVLDPFIDQHPLLMTLLTIGIWGVLSLVLVLVTHGTLGYGETVSYLSPSKNEDDQVA